VCVTALNDILEANKKVMAEWSANRIATCKAVEMIV
jgi:hypothetical protein